MAWNLYRKINETFARNGTRLLQSNAPKLNPVANALQEIRQPLSETQKPKKFNKFAVSSQRRTTPAEHPSQWVTSPFEAEGGMHERNLQNEYLQPSNIPTYKDQPIFDNQFMASLQEEQIMKAQHATTNSSASQRIVEVIKEKQAKNKPTRIPKLTSNPFPDPFKAIFSPYTLSDQEKAEQMFLDQRMYMKFPGSFSNSPGNMKPSKKFYSTATQLRETRSQGVKRLNTSAPSMDQVRLFSKKNRSNDIDMCTENKKSGKPEKPKRCSKMTIKGCPPARANTICKQKNKEVVCTKIEAPYPSFSERCYIEKKSRTTECDNCPWTNKDNPHFKGKLKIPPKFYHTESFPSSIRTPTDSETTKLGYCDINLTPLTEFFMKNEGLLRNYRNGNDLSDFGIEKSTLCKILSGNDVFDVVCKKGERLNPDYPRNCNKPYKDQSKNCPTDLTKQKTKKERLKRKEPKNPN